MKTNTDKKILDFIKKRGQTTPKEIINFINLGAPAVFRQLKKLIKQRKVEKTGKSPKVFYHLPINIKRSKINEQKLVDIKINLKEFGKSLSNRESAKNAVLATLLKLDKIISSINNIIIDFSGISVLSPGWADEFISSLQQEYPNNVILLPSDNASVNMSLEFVSKRE